MTVRLMYASWGGDPHSYHVEVDDAGRASETTTFGRRVGRFARDLTEQERAALAEALESARAADVPPPQPPDPVRAPSGVGVSLLFDDREVDLSRDDSAPDGVASLRGVMLDLAEELTESPVSAIEVDVDLPHAVRLRLVGSEPMKVRAGTLTVTATAYEAGSVVSDQEQATVDASDLDGEVQPGWDLPLTRDARLPSRPADGVLSVSVEGLDVDALGDGVLRRAGLVWSEGLDR